MERFSWSGNPDRSRAGKRTKRAGYGDPDYVDVNGITYTEDELVERCKQDLDDQDVYFLGYGFGEGEALSILDPDAFRFVYLDWRDWQSEEDWLDIYRPDHPWLDQDDDYTASRRKR